MGLRSIGLLEILIIVLVAFLLAVGAASRTARR